MSLTTTSPPEKKCHSPVHQRSIIIHRPTSEAIFKNRFVRLHSSLRPTLVNHHSHYDRYLSLNHTALLPPPRLKMQFNVQATALFSVLASTALAGDVWSTFLNSQGARIETQDHRIGDTGCINIDRATQVAFWKDNLAESHANGPYCLEAHPQANCQGAHTTFQYDHVALKRWTYAIGNGTDTYDSFFWRTTDGKTC